MRSRLFLAAALIAVLWSCGAPQSTPKPRAFPKVNYPQGKIDTFSSVDCPFTFQYYDYSDIIKDSTFFNASPGHACWFDLSTKDLNGRVHFSYYPITGRKRFDELMSDAFELSNKHNTKANYIEEIVFRRAGGVSGVVFKMDGPVASPYQFFVTDSVNHFVRGALYVNAPIKPDSLKPIYTFLSEDVDRLLNTFEWKD